MLFWKKWKRKCRLSKEEIEIRQVHRISSAVVRTILARVGEPVLMETLRELKKNREEKGESDYTSLAEIWLIANKRSEELMARQGADSCR